MNTSPDPAALERARRSVLRSMFVWTPIFTLVASVSVFFLVRAITGDAGAWIGFGILGLIALLTLPLAVAALRDIRADPIATDGPIGRKWTKSDLFVFRGHYLIIGRRVFRVDKRDWLAIPDAGDRVYLRHFPHTNTVIAWESASRMEAAADAEVRPAAAGWRPIPNAASPAAARTEPPISPMPGAQPVEQPVFGRDRGPFQPTRPGEPPPGRVDPPRFDAGRGLDRSGRDESAGV
jgi:hypothetical protein